MLPNYSRIVRRPKIDITVPVILIALAGSPLFADEPARRPYLALNERLMEKYQVHVAPASRPVGFKTQNGPVKADPVSSHAIDDYAPVFSEEFRLYPVAASASK